jgi:hypothetical protein
LPILALSLTTNQMNTDNLISLADFARESGLRPDEVTRLTTPQKIKTVIVGNRKFIDKSIYPPKSFKK